MPSGYTAIVAEKDDVTFNEFAWRCARAMGALVLMRDEPIDAPIPEKFVPDDFYEKEVTLDKQRLDKLTNASQQELLAMYDERHREVDEYYQEHSRTKATMKQRYQAMLKLVRAWDPPTEEHDGFKEFMVNQLQESMDADCYEPEKPGPKMSFEEWRKAEIFHTKRDIERSEERHAEELRRTNARNEWVAALRKSVGNPPQGTR